MDRREWLSLLGAGAAGLVAVGGQTARAAEEEEQSEEQEECMKACVTCADECNEAFRHCLKETENGHHEHARTARLTLDCAEFCGMTACLISRGSELHALACRACADACKRCGDACTDMKGEAMKDCEQACRKCEAACRKLAKA